MALQLLPPLIAAGGKVLCAVVAGRVGTKALESFTSNKNADASKSVEELKQIVIESENKIQKEKDDKVKLVEFYKKQQQEFEEQMNTRLIERDNQIISLQNQINQLKDKSSRKPSNWEVYFKWGLIVVNVIILVVGVLLLLT
ncbi:hypothetical protein EDI_325390 [Entamoeba dispar SAW760]|uniref:Uncharacterized protein n=1 Tax=Entamoeba dispar (strain ATCC PRA-260 / SAW760) TaxID=370354 RepID=B0EBQ0_ENTDS|nr:uncharacterized protein EDI_325390 [Entamoeba dispar SAW760]EDR28062.1 hypothetical protein EDI_325390 [Entamoeba dispar SAW760]|eukprot:EDR28062.1 hypothetical protein EDI_325390 [Entamoeba dispar SAW760]